MDLQRNNLDGARSPYLRQHADNPVWWQEWSPDVLRYARENDKVLFASVGYATCHWCHVMARGAFSHPDVAAMLNRDFVSIKVDREERPDIDQYLMDFLVATTGNGGWPLNAFLTPDSRPFFAMTFAAPQATHGVPPIQEILKRVVAFYREKGRNVQPFELPTENVPVRGFLDDESLSDAVSSVVNSFDAEDGGLAGRQKVPPHCGSLFLLYAGEAIGDGKNALRKTLDAMTYRGLSDHLGGGFFRYCVDSAWQIPHFEKMLYDQAMMLWTLSLAARIYDDPAYRRAALRTFDCLERDFRLGNLYVSSHDADTDHAEGATYLWDYDELREHVGPDQWEAFERTFTVTEAGNFEGKNHLIMRHPEALAAEGLGLEELDAVAARLLTLRRERPQPSVDRKLITSWNALAAVGLLQVERHLGLERAGQRALEIFDAIMSSHLGGDHLAHSSHGDRVQHQEFLSDYAAMLLLATHLREDREVDPDGIDALVAGVESFRRNESWVEASNPDFQTIPASTYDMPYPSGVALAEMALLRHRLQSGEMYDEIAVSGSIQHAFLDLAAMLAGGYFVEVESPEALSWQLLPVNSIQKRGPHQSYCHRGVCHMGLPEV